LLRVVPREEAHQGISIDRPHAGPGYISGYRPSIPLGSAGSVVWGTISCEYLRKCSGRRGGPLSCRPRHPIPVTSRALRRVFAEPRPARIFGPVQSVSSKRRAGPYITKGNEYDRKEL
jgi:hypothetical protein